MEVINRCKAIIIFSDDYGDNPCTFHCKLELDHSGKHKETGNLYKKYLYSLEWDGDMKEEDNANS